MSILLLFQRHVREILLLLFILLGFSLGQLTATLIGLGIGTPPPSPPPTPVPTATIPAAPPLTEFRTIIERNIFNAQAGSLADFGSREPAEEQEAAARGGASSTANLTLLGTVAGGPKAMAVIAAGPETDSYQLGSTLPGGTTLIEVERNRVVVETRDGQRETLEVDLDAAAANGSDRSARIAARRQAARTATPAIGSDIREIGENRWLIPAEEADRARNNINELLRQARVEPNIVDGQTDGFVVRMIRPGSLFSMLGIQVGDVLLDVNGVKLDSPEKALQIFQQLREARQINIALERQGTPQTFSYEIN